MAYADQNRKRVNRPKISLSDSELETLDAAVEIDGGERAVILRDLAMQWANSVLASVGARRHRPTLGVVDPDGDIRFCLAA